MDARICYAVSFFDMVAVSLVIPQLTTYMVEVGADPFTVGAISSIYGALQFFSAPAVGHFGDLYSRQLAFIVSILASSTGYFWLSASTSLWMIALSRVTPGLFKHTNDLCRQYVADKLGDRDDERAATLGRIDTCQTLGYTVGAAVGGVVVSWENGFRIAAFFCGCIFLVNFCAVKLIMQPMKADNVQMQQSTGPKPTASFSNKAATKPSQGYMPMLLEVMADRRLIGLFLVRMCFMGASHVFRANLNLAAATGHQSLM